MISTLKRLLGKEEIPNKAVEHSSKGEYTQSGRLKGGGHGQEALDYMDQKGIKYNITKTYSNGVRVGNVPTHKNALKQRENNQSWFPQTWDRKMIKKAGQSVAKGKKYPDGKQKTGRYKNVDVGIKRTNGKVATIYPLNKQKNKKEK